MIHLEVAVAVPIYQTLTYCLPKSASNVELSDVVRSTFIGRRALVALGKRMVTGYVVDACTEPSEKSEFTIRPIIKFLDEYSLFQETLTSFFKWVADYYQYPIGLVVKSALPGGLAPQSKIILEVLDREVFLQKAVTGDQPSWLIELCDKGKIDKKKATVKFSPRDKKLLKQLYAENCVVEKVEIVKDSVREKTEVCYQVNDPFFPKPAESPEEFGDLDAYRIRVSNFLGKKIKVSETKTLIALFKAMKTGGANYGAVKDIKKIYTGVKAPLQTFEDIGVVTKEKKRIYRSPFGEQLRHYPRPETLTKEQNLVMSELEPAIEKKQFCPFLLHGVTGCGKTEVYLRAAEMTLEQGRDVIILVPEIALATQLEAHLLSRFQDLVVLLHSGLTSAERYDQFFLALSGQARIVIGARSAIFAPLKDPGLIIVDEEHDTSYKQDDSFRYHGRDLAVLRARHQNSVVLLGSATPSVTSFENAKTGKYNLLTMKNRVGSSSLPTVELVDLSLKTNKKKNKSSIIQQRLLFKLESTIADNKQAVLLLNRRGFSTALLCKDCGTPVQCNHCNVSLTLHKGRKKLVCHY